MSGMNYKSPFIATMSNFGKYLSIKVFQILIHILLSNE
jgi:hypothetical protein